MYKQSQFALRPAGRGRAAKAPTAGAIVRNKANSPGNRIGTKPSSGKELCRIYLRQPSCRTKPIFHHSSIPIGRQSCKTNPISESGPAGGQLNCGFRIADCGLKTDQRPPRAGAGTLYKQTQFPGGESCSRIAPFHHSRPKPIVRNEPNFGGRPVKTGTDRAKQSQLAGCGNGR